MLKQFCVVAVFVSVLSSFGFSGTTLIPTTTLALETGRNTSTASTFPTSVNGNLGAANVSKEDLRKLLYPGAKAKIYAHYMAWWGNASHINIGYSSTDALQVRNQISDMLSRGINGMIIDWYGPGNTQINQSSLAVMRDSETRGGTFEFAIMEDQSQLRTCAYTTGCDVSQALINDLNYILRTFAVSPAYMRVDGRPVIFTFDVENLPNIDWTRVFASVTGNPKIIFHNNAGFRLSYSSGSYAWIPINKQNQSDWGQGYLDNFYGTGLSYPQMQGYGGVWKGFDDRAAAWTQNRIVNQNCGQVWLSTFAELNRYYSSSNELQGVQLVTWNDYEEGTAIETGIDNCVSVRGSVSSGILSWTVTGQENTIDHYTIFVSADGQNLMALANVESGIHRYSIADFKPAPGNYSFYVKAIGKPSLTNKMSEAIPFSVANLAPNVKFSITPNAGTAPVSVTASTSGSSDPDGTIAGINIDFGDGTIANTPSASHVYSNPGTYTVKAVVTDDLGSSTTVTSTVSVSAPFTITAVSPTAGSTVTGPVRFIATSASQATAIRIYVDNASVYTTSSSSLDTTLILTPGAHYVVLQAWNAQGTVAKVPLNITVVNKAPDVKLAVPATASLGNILKATVSSSDADGSIATTTIDFGDGTVVNATSATHSYPAAGTYTVKAKATDNLGASSTATAKVTISKPILISQRPTRIVQSSTTGPQTPPVAAAAGAVSSSRPSRGSSNSNTSAPSAAPTASSTLLNVNRQARSLGQGLSTSMDNGGSVTFSE